MSVTPRMYLQCRPGLSRFSRVQLFENLWAVGPQAPLSVGFSRQESWGGLPWPPPGDLSTQISDLCLLCHRHGQVSSLPLAPPGNPCTHSESEVAQSCPTLCNPMDCSLPGSSVHGIFQARVLKWVAISFSRGSSQPRDWTRVSCITSRHFTTWATRECQFFNLRLALKTMETLKRTCLFLMRKSRMLLPN